MVSIDSIKNAINCTPTKMDTDAFINLHRNVEGYIRRLYLIGLRLNGVKYETAQDVIKLSYLNNKALVQKTILLISKKDKKITDLENSSLDFKILLKLFFEYSSVIRNRVVHGIYENIGDPNVLKYCFAINRFLLLEFERVLEINGFKSAFDSPSDWGAKRVVSDEGVEDIIKRLKLGKLTPSPLRIETVIEHLSKTNYKV